MIDSRKLAAVRGAASVALFAVTGAAVADGEEGYSPPPPPPEAARKFTYSFNLAGTSDYIFRGYSQSERDPVMQGGADITYGMFYAGGWASGIDFGSPPVTGIGEDARVEIDWYGRITPTWGPASFDFGVIYYTYPGAADFLGNLDYVELKAGVSGNIHKDLTTGLTLYWSPDYTGETGSVFTLEGSAGYAFHKVWVFAPTISGVLGYQTGNNAGWKAAFANGDSNYLYWNAGLELGVEALTFDFRYWDTNVSNTGGFCTGAVFQCDSAFVFTTKVALPQVQTSAGQSGDRGRIFGPDPLCVSPSLTFDSQGRCACATLAQRRALPQQMPLVPTHVLGPLVGKPCLRLQHCLARSCRNEGIVSNERV